MRKFIGLLLVVIICFGLYITNPTRYDFKIFIEEDFRKEFDSDDSVLNNFLSGAAASMTGKLASSMSTRDDYYLFSIYSLKMGGEEVKYIGILKRFFLLQLRKDAFNELSV